MVELKSRIAEMEKDLEVGVTVHVDETLTEVRGKMEQIKHGGISDPDNNAL